MTNGLVAKGSNWVAAMHIKVKADDIDISGSYPVFKRPL